MLERIVIPRASFTFVRVISREIAKIIAIASVSNEEKVVLIVRY